MATAAVSSTGDTTSGAKKYCLSDLISLSDNVPFRVKFHTRDSQIYSQLSQDTVMDIYSIQWSKAAILSHRDQKQIEYIMPFDSSFKCSPIFNPNNNTKEATTRGYQYNSVKELQLANPQPIAVHVSMGYLDAEDMSASMEAGDVYVMRKRSQLPGATPPDDVLVCEDTVTHQFKYLHCSSSCYLNTSPSNLLLKPTDFFLSLIPPADILIHNIPSISKLSDVFVVKGIIPLLTLTTHIQSKTVVLDIYGHGELPAEVELLNVPPLEYKQMKLRAELESMTTSKDESNSHQMLIVFMTENATKVSFTNNTLQKLFLTSKQSNGDDDYILELHSAAIVKSESKHSIGISYVALRNAVCNIKYSFITKYWQQVELITAMCVGWGVSEGGGGEG